MLTLLKAFLLTAALLLGLGTFFFYLFQRQLIYFPDRSKPPFAIAKALGLEEVTLNTDDNLTLNAWYHPAQAGRPTIVHFHGNAGNISNRLYLAKELIERGYGLLLLDYRGYGGNPGSPSEQGLYLDAEAALSFLQAKQIPQNQRVIFGESIGTAVAVEMAQRHGGCALILQSPLKSLPAIVRYHHPWLLIPPMDKFDSYAKISHIKTPLLILPGKIDTIVPYRHAEALYEKAPQSKLLISYPLGTHLNLWTADFFAQIDQFLQKHCSKP